MDVNIFMYEKILLYSHITSLGHRLGVVAATMTY